MKTALRKAALTKSREFVIPASRNRHRAANAILDDLHETSPLAAVGR
jgi:hypothetical protein